MNGAPKWLQIIIGWILIAVSFIVIYSMFK